MKIIGGIVPCKDRFFLDKALVLVRAGIEEMAARSYGEFNYYDTALQLYAGNLQLYLVYEDKNNIPDNQEQAAVIAKVISDKQDDYLGFCILQFQATSFHIQMAFLLPQYRDNNGLGILEQGWAKIIAQAKLYGAPSVSLCTTKEIGEMVKRNGFTEQYTKYIMRF